MENIRYTAAGPHRGPGRRALLAGGTGLLGLLVLGAAATTTVPRPGAAGSVPAGPAGALRLGFFANLTHAPALVGTAMGFFAAELEGSGTQLATSVFGAGPAAVEALNAGAIDAAYLGPNPAIAAFAASGGQGVRVLAGAAAGGAQLVVRASLANAAALRGTTLATPQLGGTQDVALRTWLATQGLETDLAGGDVGITPTANAQTLELFRAGKIDGAWLPEPWASRLVLEAGAKVLVDEAELWDGADTGAPGLFPTTVLAVSPDFATRHPDTVDALLRGHLAALDWINTARETDVLATLNARIAETAGAALAPAVIKRALGKLSFTADPLEGAYPRLLGNAVAAGLAEPASLDGLIDTTPLARARAATSTGTEAGA
ncbi:ABC transporter substrate-binding protein [Paeniglutamicibacter sulfureus]|uniref:NitT/TauT family transport system substrate-binding protein n=1 Tax=Paeniglutamicibacter sulfureus TaxID=43666 RepID=A0ABU2BDS0_9MICC|nr:ABC transporter substrate-binding protein [Paeniglutamicibacter sulfureus]MDO2936594.1 ABC transporter substrate-binding protein [Paeniglutamicibacter sulfureus]MDR7356755.1 NitT/TauT family transport system substrate-binding protein [Paeniglutamicibacter sulfureus]